MVTLETSEEWSSLEAGMAHGFFSSHGSIPSLKPGGWAPLGVNTLLETLPSDSISSECYELPYPSPCFLFQIYMCVSHANIHFGRGKREK